MTLVPREGRPLVLAFGARDAQGGSVRVNASGTLYRLSSAALESALASRAALLTTLAAEPASSTPENPR